MEEEHVEIEEESEFIPVSALEHYSYCPRQWALIYVEQVFDENIFTQRGHFVHQRVEEGDTEVRDGVRVERSLPIWSDTLGLVGKADVVEFHGETPYPVEYKHGPLGDWGHAELQLCAQAMCLEEMLGVRVPHGAVYHYSSRRRKEVLLTDELRHRVRETIAAIRRMLAEGRLPPPADDGRCRHCSLKEACAPSLAGQKERAARLASALFKEESFQ